MKNILVLTDFSENSVNAYRYAVKMACQLQTNILLVFSSNGKSISLTNQMQYSQMLHSFAKRHACDSRQKTSPHHTECLISGEKWVNAIPLLIQVHQPDLVVAGSALLAHCEEENVLKLKNIEQCPIIWVPEKATYQPFKKIVFATDFTDQDPAVIEKVKELATQFKAEVSLVHFYSSTDRNRLAEIKREAVQLHWLLAPTGGNYILVEEEDLMEGLEEFAQNNDLDLFILATRDTHLAHQYFAPVYCKTQACQTSIPLLNLYQEKKKACAGSCQFCHSELVIPVSH